MSMSNRALAQSIGSCFALAIGLTLASTCLSATTITFGGTAFGASGASSIVPGAQVETFEAGLPSNYGFSVGDTLNGIDQGAIPAVASPPTNDTSHYLATGAGSVTITYSRRISYFGLLWGSVDSYNTVTLRSGTTAQTYTGTDILSAPGLTALNGSAYVNFFAAGSSWDTVILASSKANFELDNIATVSIPEPSSVALLACGFLLAGFQLYKRKNANSLV